MLEFVIPVFASDHAHLQCGLGLCDLCTIRGGNCDQNNYCGLVYSRSRPTATDQVGPRLDHTRTVNDLTRTRAITYVP